MLKEQQTSTMVSFYLSHFVVITDSVNVLYMIALESGCLVYSKSIPLQKYY